MKLSDPTSKHHCMFTVPNEDVEIGVIYESTEGTIRFLLLRQRVILMQKLKSKAEREKG